MRSGRWVPAGTVTVHAGASDGPVVGRCRPDLGGHCSLRIRGLAVAVQPLVGVFRPARGFRADRAGARVAILRPAWMEPAALTPAAGAADPTAVAVIATLSAPEACRVDRTVLLVRSADAQDAPPRTLAAARTDAAGRATLVLAADVAAAADAVRAEVVPDGRCEEPASTWGPLPVAPAPDGGEAPGGGEATDATDAAPGDDTAAG
ncbi:MAG: hypothetical protein ACKOTZ_03455 [Chloroflexota bacterium]